VARGRATLSWFCCATATVASVARDRVTVVVVVPAPSKNPKKKYGTI